MLGNNSHHIEAANWFKKLRDNICDEFETIESKFTQRITSQAAKFERKIWQRPDGGGGEISLMKGEIFEKVGVNISTVHGEFSQEFSQNIPGTEKSRDFFATGISVVAHMRSPLIPAVHFNTRYIKTGKEWFGGGADLTPMYVDDKETEQFHQALKKACDQYDDSFYPKFKQQCDQYFYLEHRKEPRGVGGIFYDYLNTNNFKNDLSFTKEIGKAFLFVYKEIVNSKAHLPWTKEQREHQLIKRGRYVEFNLLYDRGTTFGLKTGGNVEAIFMSLPPEVKWH
ncbi:MAG: oxygen-dependent coproporphyrinogen oxidase [Rickettsiaceae bacterium]|nr:MAG: oxygen-dependent coproporphyrinogen oxidase [Rickettsiaceae bacterium]